MTGSGSGLYIDPEKLAAFGENTARRLTLTGDVPAKRIARSLNADLARIRRVHDLFEKKYHAASEAPGAAEWLLDNWYLVQREGKYAAGEFLTAGRVRGTGDGPLLTEACGALVRSGMGEVTAARIEAFVSGFQRVLPLSRSELSLLVPGVRAALAAELADACAVKPEACGKIFGAIMTSLRLLGTLDLSELLERIDLTEQILRQDPAGIYPLMDERTRDLYRRTVTRLARAAGTDEQRLAREILARAEAGEGGGRHVGYWLFTKPLGRAAKERRGGAYIAANLLLTLFISLLAGFAAESAAAALLLLLPVSELVKNILDFVIGKLVPPRRIPRMELAEGVPPEGKTVCVVSVLLTAGDSGAALARRLEEFRLANRDCGENLLFGLLADLPEGKEKTSPGDGEAIRAAKDAVDGLNTKYGGGFYLFGRTRQRSRSDKIWLGYERKRGALLALARLLLGAETELGVLSGDCAALNGARYILTLDADTRLAPGTARELVGAMLHPLNAPVVDAKRRVVTSGRGVIHPRIGVELPAATASGFSRLFAGQGGCDPYGSACGELYMDLFGRGGFTGKGIIDAAALLACTGDLPENLILSHDAVEGAVLRGGYMSDTEVMDGFPASPLAYYRRMHRWTRGDWQNLSFIFGRGRSLSDIDRWKLLDSLRRSLVAPMTFAAIFAGFLLPERGVAIAAAAALLALASHLLLTLAETSFRPGDDQRVRYHSAVIHGVGGALVETLVRLILLPVDAWVCASAIFTALWRMAVSHRRLLSWQTAAQAEPGGRNGILSYYSGMWFAPAAGAAALFLSSTIIGRAAGIIWLFAPLFAFSLGRRAPAAAPLRAEDRAYLLERSREIWHYFETFCTEENRFLPPDNWQEQPPVGTACRTSPTNIGLALVSALAALDLGLSEKARAAGLAENILGALESLPKWHGHPYNWYDTRTMRSLEPKYVSTVDSGNLAACLTVFRAGMIEYGRPDLAERAAALFAAMDFRPLYDASRRLFIIGFDVSTNAPSKGWYDLMASEARLTGYIAVAKGDAPRRHWRQLSRAMVQKDGYRGMASWTGTMFEYLMPELFLPLCRESLLWESAKFCLYTQRRRVHGRLPWGVSESAFFSLDPALSYRYKAHGCAALALKRGMDEELVISPYSSFLALVIEPENAVRNLRRLEKLSPPGCFGFWEAVDFTPSRCRFENGETVRCVMAHHLGMSLAALDNCLCGGAMQKRFMSDPAMAAYRGFIEEMIPVGGILLRRRGTEPPDKPARTPRESWDRHGSGTDCAHPECCLLSNGVYNMMLTETGLSAASAGSFGIYRGPHDPLTGPGGLAFRLDCDPGGGVLLPLRGGDAPAATWAFGGASAGIADAGEGFSFRCSAAVSANDTAELRLVALTSAAGLKGQLILEFEPMLAKSCDYVNHPAFFRLGLHAQMSGGALLLRRLPRGGLPGAWLCLACDRPMDVSANDGGKPLGWLSAPFVRASVPFEVPPGGVFSTRFALAFGAGPDEVYAAAQRTLGMGTSDFADLSSACAALYGMPAREVSAAMGMVSALAFPRVSGPVTEGREALWRLGISGDLPIVSAAIASDEQLPAARDLIRRHALLRACGLRSDLVFLTGEGGDYLRAVSRSVSDILAKLGLEAVYGASGGVYTVDSNQAADAVGKNSALVVGLDAPEKPRRRDTGKRWLPPPAPRRGGAVGHDWSEDGTFNFYVNHFLPPKAWANLLVGEDFGFLATDAGTGSLWYKNARECRITPWNNDPRAAAGPETLELAQNGRRVSLFAAEDGFGCRVSFGFGTAVWEKNIGDRTVRTTAFVPPGRAARVLVVEGAPSEVFWRAELELAGDDRDAKTVITNYVNHIFTARNARSPYPDTEFTAVFSDAPTGATCDLAAWLRGETDGACGAGLLPCFGAVLPPVAALVVVCGCCGIEALRALAEPGAAMAALEQTRQYWAALTGRLRVKTPDEALNRYMNGWAAYQTVACRLMGRCSLYQSGGAFGFRDQLQDAVNMILIDPSLARRRIIDCCAHQYAEGDVMHWWHPESCGDKGVRTRCSDDLLWLPWAVCEYAEKTGDDAVLSETAPFLRAQPLGPDERSRYETPGVAEVRGSVADHAALALALVIRRGAGDHGLLLMGGGDWNDGMDAVGEKGRGESVWLTWFFSHTARRFAALLEKQGRKDEAAAALSAAVRFGRAADRAWDGSWYLRGYYDDGSPLGGKESAGCRIDSIAQSWAAFCAESGPEKRGEALDAALAQLFDRENGLVRLFDPPFGDGTEEPGYVKSYGPGFRENGGQYTHGAIWLASACLREGRTADGLAILRTLLPRGGGPYGAEPFVLAADVYSNPDRCGEAGWSWYTGSAGWYFRVVAEDLLGLRLAGGKLAAPAVPPAGWDAFEAVWTDGCGEEHRIAAAREDPAEGGEEIHK
jgi:cyclic beta-1,2-glucan synthetase